MSAIFLLPACLTYWLRKYTTRVDPYFDNSHQVWSWYDHPLPSYSVLVWWYDTWPGDLDLLPFDLEQLSYMAGHVPNHATKFEDPTTIRSWGTSYNVSLWLALEMRTRPLRMRRITWLVSRGSKTITYLESPTPICLFTKQLYWATTTIKGRLMSSVINAKTLDCVNFLCVTLWPWPLTFWPRTVVIHGKSRDHPSHQVRRPHAYPFLIYEL